MIRLVTFDALHTLITPRKSIYVQYSEVLRPYLGELAPDALARSFKLALKQLQDERPTYKSGATSWWTEVIRRTAIGAGADAQAMDQSINEIVPNLMQRFSSSEGYRLFDDTLGALQQLKAMNVRTGLITNADSRVLSSMKDLGVLQYLSPVVVSEKVGFEKPSIKIFLTATVSAKVKHSMECLHVGDELKGDYMGAENAGFRAILIRRPGPHGCGEHKEEGEDLRRARVAHGLDEVVQYVRKINETYEPPVLPVGPGLSGTAEKTDAGDA